MCGLPTVWLRYFKTPHATRVLRQINRKTNPIGEGGAVDAPMVITMGHGLGVEVTHETVGDAFRALATE